MSATNSSGPASGAWQDMPDPGAPMVNPNTGVATPAWWQWLLSVYIRTGGQLAPNMNGVIGLDYVQAEVEDALALVALPPPEGALGQGIASALTDAAVAQRPPQAPDLGLPWPIPGPLAQEPDFLAQFLAAQRPALPGPARLAWTPQLLFGGAHAGMTGSFVGEVVTYGPLVWVFSGIALTAKGGSAGNATISGLPIPIAASQSCRFAVSGASGFAGGVIEPGVLGVTSTISLFTSVAAFADTNITDANFTNATQLQFSGWYFLA